MTAEEVRSDEGTMTVEVERLYEGMMTFEVRSDGQ